jgi:hypothetical protein
VLSSNNAIPKFRRELAKKAVLRKEIKIEELEQMRIASIEEARKRREAEEEDTASSDQSSQNYVMDPSCSQILSMLETIKYNKDLAENSKSKEMMNCSKCKLSLRPGQLKVHLFIILLLLCIHALTCYDMVD